VKKAFLGCLASLMIAGAISAASGLTTHTATGAVVIIGDGASPIPLPAGAAGDPCDVSSLNK
jgi:hypothetical protein